MCWSKKKKEGEETDRREIEIDIIKRWDIREDNDEVISESSPHLTTRLTKRSTPNK